jgi:hypothetical protein
MLPKAGEYGPRVGKADFYTLRYGEYLIGMNCSEQKTFELRIPEGARGKRAPELISGKSVELKEAVSVPALTTVVLWLAGE